MSYNQFFEKCGRLFFSKIRPALFFTLTVFPVLSATVIIYFEKENLHELEARFTKAARKEKVALQRKERKEKFIERYSHPDPYFVNQQIETHLLLQAEKERLEALLLHPAFPNSEMLKARLQFLKENRLSFSEQNNRSSTKIKETEEKQRHPVQMDEKDLQKILSLIEDVPIGSNLPLENGPQVIIKELRIKKQETPLQTQIFEVDMDLLKREFIK